MLGVVGGIIAGEELMMSINCLLYLSGLICLRMVLALITLLLMPSMLEFVEVSLPSQMAGQNLASIFGICFAGGSM